MSRIANNPVSLPKGVDVELAASQVTVKGAKGALTLDVHHDVEVTRDKESLRFSARNRSQQAKALAGTTRALVNNMVQGVSVGFEKKLQLVGVGYKAQAQGNKLNLNLGFSHPVAYELPKGVTAETPSQTEVIIRGVDKQQVGQIAAEVRAIRSPEPYKGKGVRYAGERIRIKEAKKK